MKWRRKYSIQISEKSRQPVWILFFLALFAMAGIIGSSMVLENNADYMGQRLVQSYAREEGLNLSTYANMVRIGMSYIDSQAAEGESVQSIEEWIVTYFQRTKEGIEGNVAEAYAVLNGRLISDRAGLKTESYDYTAAVWYRLAIEAEGEVIVTPVYKDGSSGEAVVTIAAANPVTGNAVLFDLFAESFQYSHQDQDLPENTAYYICDTAGELLYSRAPFAVSQKELQTHAGNLYSRICAEEINSGSTIEDFDGKRRSVYYCYTSEGWLCILTIPLESLYDNMFGLYIYYAATVVAAVAVIVLVWLRERRILKYIKSKNDTINMLGNSYYAIYRINTEDRTYEMTKGSEYVRERLPYKGEYVELLRTLVDCMDEETGRDFARNFSMVNIISLAEQGTRDFGGDFHRRFTEGYKWVNVRLVQDPQNSPGEAVLCFRKVEEEKQKQLQNMRLMESALAAADANEKSQRQFFSSMSHDMRTPLNAIIGMADLGLRTECTSEKRTDYFEKISVSGRQLLTLINDILEMSRLEQGKIDLDNRTFNICETLEECAAPFEIQAREEGKSFHVNMDVSSPVVCADPTRLTQILNNLISNAIKFTGSGDEIDITLRQEKGVHDRYRFTVRDSGVGMSEEFLPHLFEPYEREKRFDVQKVTGTGLGMPIVKKLVSQMGGEITVSSRLGKGTRFEVVLPFMAGSIEPAAEKKDSDYAPLEGKRVLLAEDNPLNTEIVSELLAMKGIQISTAGNGREALERFSQSEEFFFDAILMDMQMPEMDGCEAAKRIRGLKRADAKRVPIIALTANAFPEDIARTTAAGMNDHLCKPIEPEVLWAALLRVQ